MSALNVTVDQYMSSPVHVIEAGEKLGRAHELLSGLAVSCLGVTNGEGRLEGVLSVTDLLRVGRRDAGSSTKAALLTLPDADVAKHMTRKVETVAPSDTLPFAASKMAEHRIHHVFVEDEGRPVGVLGTRDVMGAIRDQRAATPISRWMSSPIFTVRASEPIGLATDRLEKAHVSGLIVVDDGWPVGIFSQREALESRDLPRDTHVDHAMSAAMLALDVDTPLHRAAAQAADLRVRRIVAVHGRKLEGILTGIDLVRSVAG